MVYLTYSGHGAVGRRDEAGLVTEPLVQGFPGGDGVAERAHHEQRAAHGGQDPQDDHRAAADAATQEPFLAGRVHGSSPCRRRCPYAGSEVQLDQERKLLILGRRLAGLAQRFQAPTGVAGELMQSSFVEAVQQEALSPAGSPSLEVVKMDIYKMNSIWREK